MAPTQAPYVVVHAPAPTTPCVETRLFTCHFYFSPAIHLRVRPPFGWEVVPQSDAQLEVRTFGGRILLELLATSVPGLRHSSGRVKKARHVSLAPGPGL